MSNTKAWATLVTVHISTNLYMIFIFHYLLTYWFCEPSYTVSAVYVHESTCMTVHCHHLKYSYNFIPKNFFSIYRGPARGGSHVACLNFKTSRVGVYKMLVAYCGLCRHCCDLAERGCLLSRFHFTHCHYFLGHVACWNLPWQGLFIAIIIMAHLETNYFLIVSKLDPGVWWGWNEDFAQTLKRCLWQGGKCGKKNTAWMCEMLKSFHEQQGNDFRFRWFWDS